MPELLTTDGFTLSAALVAIFLGAWNLLKHLIESKGGSIIDNFTQAAQAERELSQAQAQAAIRAKEDEREQSQLMQLRAFESSNQTMAALLAELKVSNEFTRGIVEETLEGHEKTIVRIHSRLDKLEQLLERNRQQHNGQIQTITEGHKEAMGEIGLTITALSERMAAWTEAIEILKSGDK